MSDRFDFRFSRDFIGKETAEAYRPYLEERYGNTYDHIVDFINSTVQGVTVPGISIENPMQRKYRKSSVSAINHMGREFSVELRRIEGYANLYPLLEESLHHYDNTGESMGSCTLFRHSKIFPTVFRIEFLDCVVNEIDLPDNVDFGDLEPEEGSFSLTLEWNDIKMRGLPDL